MPDRTDPHAVAGAGVPATIDAPGAIGVHPYARPETTPQPATTVADWRSSPQPRFPIAAPPPAQSWLAGEHAPLPRRGVFAVLEGLLRSPANLMYELATHPSTHLRLLVIMLVAMSVTGLVVGGFSGGYQLLAAPLKLALGMTLCGLLCLPSLYVFACLSGAQHSLRDTAGALLAGVSLTALLLVGFAPVSWVFSQATDSSALMGGLHLFFLLVSAHFGLRLTRRALASVGGRPVPALWLWSAVFLMVVLQMSTTLRPLVGPFEGLALADKQFFLAHWLS